MVELTALFITIIILLGCEEFQTKRNSLISEKNSRYLKLTNYVIHSCQFPNNKSNKMKNAFKMSFDHSRIEPTASSVRNLSLCTMFVSQWFTGNEY